MSKKIHLIRKSVHLITGSLIFTITYIEDRNILLALFIAGALFSFVTFNYKSFHTLHKTPDSSLGTLFYPAGVITAFLILYDQPLFYFRTVILILTISDIAAWSAGQIAGSNSTFRIGGDRKSPGGILAFFATGFLIMNFYLSAHTGFGLSWILLALIVSVILEVISFKGSDNLTIPAGLAFFFVMSETYPVNPSYLTGIILLMAAGCILLYKLNILNRTGSLSAFLLGIYFITVPGMIWLIPVLYFFLSSVFLTKLNTYISKKRKSSSIRNAWQVFSNIIWALLSSVLFLITLNDIFIFFFISFLAAVTADTWASELGQIMHKKSFSIADHKMHPAGFTGGISAGGTLAAFAGSSSLSAISYLLFFGEFQFSIIVLLSLSGFLACFADTFLGTFAEKQFMKWDFLSKGKQLSANDLVNILGSATGPLFFIILSGF